MNVPNFSSFELTNLVAKILNQRQNINEKDEHGDDEKGKLVSLEPMNSLSGKEDSRTSMNISSEVERRTPEIMGRCASWWATSTFFLCLCSLKFSKPLLQPQGPNSPWLAIVGMFSFTVFVSAASVMLVVGAQFTRMQITVMLSAFLALLLA